MGVVFPFVIETHAIQERAILIPARDQSHVIAATVRALRLPKYFFSGFPRDLWGSSKLLMVLLGLVWLLDRRGFLKLLIHIAHNINHKIVEPFAQWPEKSYNETEREIERALLAAATGEGQWEELIKLITPFLKLFLFTDNTYKSRVQDGLSEGISIKETLDILIKRETRQGISKTWKFIKYALMFALLTSPALSRILKRFFAGLNREKIEMDEHDKFFAYLYKSYDFGGLPRPERKKEWERLVREHHVVFLMMSAKDHVKG